MVDRRPAIVVVISLATTTVSLQRGAPTSPQLRARRIRGGETEPQLLAGPERDADIGGTAFFIIARLIAGIGFVFG